VPRIFIKNLAEYFNTTESEIRKRTTKKLNALISTNEGMLPTIVIAEMGLRNTKSNFVNCPASEFI
jgi:hypothetical protein